MGIEFVDDPTVTAALPSGFSDFYGKYLRFNKSGTYLVHQMFNVTLGETASGVWTGLMEEASIAGIAYTFGVTNYRSPVQLVCFKRQTYYNTNHHCEILHIADSQAPATVRLSVQAELAAKSNANNNLNAGDFSTRYKCKTPTLATYPNLCWIIRLEKWGEGVDKYIPY